ncbi:MAG: hypothetical protein PHZ00_03940 [Candidatus Peribacteraceae bacterium]|nr:hypothetical protein [Candidatus Peribacteraceae bacterium]
MKHISILSLSILTVAAMPLTALSRQTAVKTGQVRATLAVEQISPSRLGSWTILSGENPPLSSSDDGVDKTRYSFSLTSFGPTVISVVPPPGMSAAITIYRGGTIVTKTTVPQFSFNLLPNDNYRFLVQYSLARLSGLGVTSEPSGAKFRIKAPTGRFYGGVTPADFTNLPAGKYSLLFGRTGDCLLPPPRSIVLKPDQRNIINVKMTCTVEETGPEIIRSSVTKRSIRQIVEEREAKKRGERK